ncbi:hypothetical protein [Salaquimonas pukyongi]|uniref:hypothetical protein n=1 Tax=Salaquimonas pukyongi TaxID=2712698 RepID=UPI00096BB2D1|nr:hypothetical protein [Salaquimonas pukyongi]
MDIDDNEPPPAGETPAPGEGGQSAAPCGVQAAEGEPRSEENFSPEQRWTARIAYEHHGLATGQIARLIGTQRAKVEAWRIAGDWQARMPAESETATRTVTAELARETMAAIRRDLAALGREAKEANTADIEKRARAHLALTKSVRDLEAMVKDLEQTADAGRYPTDVVEFRSELERRIAAIAAQATAPCPD